MKSLAIRRESCSADAVQRSADILDLHLSKRGRGGSVWSMDGERRAGPDLHDPHDFLSGTMGKV